MWIFVGLGLSWIIWLCFIASPAVAISVPGYVCYTSELLPLVCFIFLLALASFFLCILFCLFVWEMCKLRFSYPLNRQGINFWIIWGTALSQYKGVYAPFCLCLRMSDHLNCQFLTVFKETLTEERKKPFRVCLQGTEVAKEVFNNIYILSFPSWISMG